MQQNVTIVGHYEGVTVDAQLEGKYTLYIEYILCIETYLIWQRQLVYILDGYICAGHTQ